MSSLLAHIHAHTVWLMRREQNMPDPAMRRFTAKAFILELTYSSFIVVHFWCGLLLAHLLLNDTARMGGHLLTDTLKLF